MLEVSLEETGLLVNDDSEDDESEDDEPEDDETEDDVAISTEDWLKVLLWERLRALSLGLGTAVVGFIVKSSKSIPVASDCRFLFGGLAGQVTTRVSVGANAVGSAV